MSIIILHLNIIQYYFDEIHQIFTDLGNGTKHARYDHGTLFYCDIKALYFYSIAYSNLVVKKGIVVKNPGALWVEIENFCP